MKTKLLILAGVATLATAGAALAAVTFDPATGTGFVGKGDVQLAYGWNNAAMQSRHTAVTFKYASETTYHYDCTFTVIVGRDRTPVPQTVTRGQSASVNGSISSDSRKTGQWTGWTLTGFGSTTSTGGDAPVDGGSCPGGPLNDGVISNVQVGSSTGGLYAVYLGDERLVG